MIDLLLGLAAHVPRDERDDTDEDADDAEQEDGLRLRMLGRHPIAVGLSVSLLTVALLTVTLLVALVVGNGSVTRLLRLLTVRGRAVGGRAVRLRLAIGRGAVAGLGVLVVLATAWGAGTEIRVFSHGKAPSFQGCCQCLTGRC